ncbi:MAG: hypothetical protein MUE55_00815 [Thermoplasmata archaeon]|jgi:hypothetical protein|nr:hypothetical protein [Thermoplasmata archaeon]
MLKEEFRTHASYSGQERFLTFPVFVFFLATIVGMTLDGMLERMTLTEMAFMTHMSVFVYGLSVGTFGLMGKQYLERRYGRSNFLVAMPYLLPISFRKTFLGIYLRDAIFYVCLLLIPATLGLVLSSAYTGYSLVSIGLFFASVLLTFMIGLSLSFFASVVFVRSVKWFMVVTAAIIIAFVAYGVLDIVGIETIIPSMGLQTSVRPFLEDPTMALVYAAASVAEVAVLTALSYYLVEIRISITSHQYEDRLPAYHARIPVLKGLYRTLVAKEFVDLRRSGTVAKMFFSFVLPLLFLSLTVWFVNYGLSIPVGFNSVFYAAMVGFVSTLMYSWLNNIDLAEYYSMLPVTVPQLIKVRMAVFLVLTMGISAFFVVAISAVNGDLELLWLALVVMFVTSLYMVAVTAYLTGLKTNTFLFDTSVLGKFSVMSFLPDVGLTILSFSLVEDWFFAVTGLALVLGSMLITTWILYRGIDAKWSKTAFAD